jgi:hypothetical protein
VCGSAIATGLNQNKKIPQIFDRNVHNQASVFLSYALQFTVIIIIIIIIIILVCSHHCQDGLSGRKSSIILEVTTNVCIFNDTVSDTQFYRSKTCYYMTILYDTNYLAHKGCGDP